METVIALAQVFLLVFIIVVGAWLLGLGLCRMADDDEQQMEWIRAQAEKNRRKKEQKSERARWKRR